MQLRPSLRALIFAATLFAFPAATRAAPITYVFTGGVISSSLSSGFEAFNSATFSGTLEFDSTTVLPVSYTTGYAATNVAYSIVFSNGFSASGTRSLELRSPWVGAIDLLSTRGPDFSESGGEYTAFGGDDLDPLIGTTPNPNNIMFGGVSFSFPTGSIGAFDTLPSLEESDGLGVAIQLANDITGSNIGASTGGTLVPEPSLLGLVVFGLIPGSCRWRRRGRQSASA